MGTEWLSGLASDFKVSLETHAFVDVLFSCPDGQVNTWAANFRGQFFLKEARRLWKVRVSLLLKNSPRTCLRDCIKTLFPVLLYVRLEAGS
jgi:hypothetical protein